MVFGHNIQLLHVNSHKFVTAQPRKLAETEKDCIMLALESQVRGRVARWCDGVVGCAEARGHCVDVHATTHGSAGGAFVSSAERRGIVLPGCAEIPPPKRG